ncbi:MAG: toll-Interleukin receptor [Burkholderiales bacterium]
MILSESYLWQQAKLRDISILSKQRIINENVKLSQRLDMTEKKYDLFLSHSSLDKTLVLTLVQLFNEASYSIYVDWIEDTELDRNSVTKETADILKKRMNASLGLAYIATKNSIDSKWCPWELGYFDGKKNTRCCILPIIEERAFRGQEYYGLYPYLEYDKSKAGKNEFWVHEQSTNKYVLLRSWLLGEEPREHQ